MKLVTVFPVLRSLVQNIAQILEYFAQSCDCVIPAFKNSAYKEWLCSMLLWSCKLSKPISIPGWMGQTSLILTFDHTHIRETELFWPTLIQRPPFRDGLIIQLNTNLVKMLNTVLCYEPFYCE